MDGDSWIGGTVELGSGRGRDLGFPTANLKLDDEQQRPSDGVYAVQVMIGDDDRVWPGALHVGPRPTFDDTASVEVHIIDWPDEDLYGRPVSFKLVERLRGVEDFGTADKLGQALAKDVDDAKRILINVK